MRVLVTGATSGLGRNAVEELLRRGCTVRATGRNEAQGSAVRSLGATFDRVDLATMSPTDALGLVRGVDAVWHCAALSSPWGKQQDFEAVNVRATRMLAQAAVAMDVPRFVHISTSSIYFDFRHQRDVPETYRAARFANACVSTKAQAEAAVLKVAKSSPQTTFVILRPRALFGPHDRVFLPRFLALLRQHNGVLTLPNGGRAVMDFTYVENAVHAMFLATTAGGLQSGEAFNITNRHPSSLAGLLDGLLKKHAAMDYRIRSVPYPMLAGVARAMEMAGHVTGRDLVMTRYCAGSLHYGMTLDNRKARTLLNYVPQYDMDEGVRRTARWNANEGGR